MSTAAQKRPETTSPPARRQWSAHIWEGIDFIAWMRLLIRNRFAVSWRHLHVAVIVTFVSLFHTLLRWLQTAWFGRRVRNTPIREAPVFIIGHWRTGTTLLHELLILDERHTYPNSYQCMEPNHFLLTERFITRWLWFLMPNRRPMDNMATGWNRPQEDEFALCMMGLPSPYLTVAFPNHGPQYPEYLDLEGVPPRALERWKRGFVHFLRLLTFKDSRRLILKSPPHTCRIKVILELFPEARFVHIVRDPYVVFPSTVNLWKSLYETQGLQRPTCKGLEEHVLATFTHVYEKLEQNKSLIDPSRFFELRYEDLVQDPVGRMRTLYEHLGLGQFDKVLPRLEQYLASLKGYETNRYELSSAQRAEISRRWGTVIRQYGYAREAMVVPTTSVPVAPAALDSGGVERMRVS